LAAAREQILLQGRRDRFAEAEKWARLAEALLARLGSPTADAASLYNGVGNLRRFQGRLPEAAVALQKSLDLARKLVPPDPRRVAKAQAGLCTTKQVLSERITCCRRAVEMATAAYGPHHPDQGIFLGMLADALDLEPTTHAEACRLYRQALGIVETNLSPSHPNVVGIVTTLAQCLQEQGDVEEAQRLYKDAIARKPGPFDMGMALDSYGFLQMRYGSLEEAVPALRLALSNFLRVLDPCSDLVLNARSNLAGALNDSGHPAEAEQVLQDGIFGCSKTAGAANLRTDRGGVLLSNNRVEPALRSFEESLRIHKTLGTAEADLAYPLHGMGSALLRLGRTDSALDYLERAFKVQPPVNLGDPELRAEITFTLARALGARKRTPERSCGLAREAANIYRPLRNGRRKVAEIDRWLELHTCPPAS
jgi:tetratricopeptide (TPR) repeat protein